MSKGHILEKLSFINKNEDVSMVLVLFTVTIQLKYWSFDTKVFIHHKDTNAA
jgi:hypothetical protein